MMTLPVRLCAEITSDLISRPSASICHLALPPTSCRLTVPLRLPDSFVRRNGETSERSGADRIRSPVGTPDGGSRTSP